MTKENQIPVELFNKILDSFNVSLEYWVSDKLVFDFSYQKVPLDAELIDDLIPGVTKDGFLKALKECAKEFDASEIESEVLSSPNLRTAIQVIGNKYIEKEPERQLKTELARQRRAKEEKERTERTIKRSNEWAETIAETAHNYVLRTGLPYYSFDGMPAQNRFSSYTKSFLHSGGSEFKSDWLDDETVLSLLPFIPSLNGEESFLEKSAIAFSLANCSRQRGDTENREQQWRKIVYFPSGECLPEEEVYTVCRAVCQELLFMAIRQEIPDLSFQVSYNHKKKGTVSEQVQLQSIWSIDRNRLYFKANSQSLWINSIGNSFHTYDSSSILLGEIRPADSKSSQKLKKVYQIFHRFLDSWQRRNILDTLSFELGITGGMIGKPTLNSLQQILKQCKEIEDIKNQEIAIRDGRKRPATAVVKNCRNLTTLIIEYLFLHLGVSINLNRNDGQFVFYPREIIDHVRVFIGGYIYDKQTRNYISCEIIWNQGSTSMRCGNDFYRVNKTDKDLKTLAWLSEMMNYFHEASSGIGWHAKISGTFEQGV